MAFETPVDRYTQRFRSFVDSPRVAAAVRILAGGVALFLLVQLFGKAYREQGYDFTSYLLSASALGRGENPYATGSVFPYIYPLFLCVVLLPFASIPYWMANLLWFLVGVVAAGFSFPIVLREFAPGLPSKTVVTLALLILLVLLNVTQNNLVNGQVNFVVILLSALFYSFLRAGRKWVASFFLACAIALKLTPGIFLFYLLIRREYLTLAGTLVLTLVLAAGLPMLFAGSAVLDFYTIYLRSFLFAAASSSPGHAGAFSLGGVAQQLFDLKADIALTLGSLAIVLMPAGILQVTARDAKGVDCLAFLLYMTGTLLVTPMSETHHLAGLFLPLGAVATGLYRGFFARPVRAFALLSSALLLLVLAPLVFIFNLVAILIVVALLMLLGREMLLRGG